MMTVEQEWHRQGKSRGYFRSIVFRLRMRWTVSW